MTEIARAIDTVIRDALAAPLRAGGYRKDGRNFRRVSGRHTRVVNVQGSSWNSAAEGQFTLNLGIYFPALVPFLDWARAAERPTEADCAVRERIGFLLPLGRDFWWRVTPASDLAALAGEVRRAWDDAAAPWFEQHDDLAAARAYAVRKRLPYWAAAASLALDEPEAARTYLDEALAGWEPGSDGAERLRAWGRRHGLVAAAV